MSFSEKLYELRKASGLSQEQLAEKCNVTRQSVSKWELGQGYPETEKLLVLCRVLDVNLDYLLRDEIASQSVPGGQVTSNPYLPYLGKWVSLLLHDRGLGAIPLAAITAMNDAYVVFEMNGKKRVRKMGVIKLSDIQVMSEARISEKKAAALGAVEIFDLKNADNPYKLFTGKKCAIKLRRSDFSRSLFSGDVYVDWLPSAEIIAVTDENMTVLFDKKEMLVRSDDVLTVIES
jgi:transcriptional regulator with XRE-family HTH domain